LTINILGNKEGGQMTLVRRAAEDGEGELPANFREMSASSRYLIEKIVTNLRKAGIHGVLSYR
jgi:repressor of nif and glnA expression